ncbi:MAG: diguanylate cyclase [Candidatus Micrarchaeia archaeon]
MPRQRREVTDLHVLRVTGAAIRERNQELLKELGNKRFYFLTNKRLNKLKTALIDSNWHSEESEKTAGTHPVTGIDNRLSFDSFLPRWQRKRENFWNPLLRLVKKGKPIDPKLGVTFIHLDLGALKKTNAVHGYAYGDVMLDRAARVIDAVASAHNIPENQVFHQGGDEFVVAVTGADSRERAESIASGGCDHEPRLPALRRLGVAG